MAPTAELNKLTISQHDEGDTHKLAPQIVNHACNRDCSMVAICPNTNEVHIYATNNALNDTSKWTRRYVLDEHVGLVSGIDWSPVHNLIVTCGHDRNSYVWTYQQENDCWKPSRVFLRIPRAATCVKWSPNGKKFALGSGAKALAICTYEAPNDWWISKLVRAFDSTVLSVGWCPNSKFVVAAGSDKKCRIISVYLPAIDSEESDNFGGVFPDHRIFGAVVAEFKADAWVHCVAWSPASFRLAFASHDSKLHFVQIVDQSKPEVQTHSYGGLPYLSLNFYSDNTLLAAGFDNNIDVWEMADDTHIGPQWSFREKVDKLVKPAPVATTSVKNKAFAAARGLFGDAVQKGLQVGSSETVRTETDALTRHKNTITNILLLHPNEGEHAPPGFSTAALDGRVLYWDLQSLHLKL